MMCLSRLLFFVKLILKVEKGEKKIYMFKLYDMLRLYY